MDRFYRDNNINNITVADKKIIRVLDEGKAVYPHIAKEGLVVWQDFRGKTNYDNIKNVVYDYSGNNKRGTLINFGYDEASGWSNSGLTFDGVKDYIITSNLDLDGSQFTIELAYESFNVGAYIYMSSSSTTLDYALLIEERSAGSFRIRVWSTSAAGSGVNYSLGNIRGDGVLQITYSSGVMRVYFNNQRINQHNIPYFRNFHQMYLGRYPAGGATTYLKCEMREVTIYNRALSESELYENYKALINR